MISAFGVDHGQSIAKREWKNITERQTNIQQANRRKRHGGAVLGAGATGVVIGGPIGMHNFKTGMGHTKSSVKGGYKLQRAAGTSRLKSAKLSAGVPGRVLRHTVTGAAATSLGVGALALGGGMMASGAIQRRYQEKKIADLRRKRA